MIKVSRGTSYSGRNVASGRSEPPASTEIAEHVYVANDNTKRTKCAQRAAGGEPSQSEQTQQRHIRSVSDLAGLEFTRKAQQESQQVTNVNTKIISHLHVV